MKTRATAVLIASAMAVAVLTLSTVGRRQNSSESVTLSSLKESPAGFQVALGKRGEPSGVMWFRAQNGHLLIASIHRVERSSDHTELFGTFIYDSNSGTLVGHPSRYRVASVVTRRNVP